MTQRGRIRHGLLALEALVATTGLLACATSGQTRDYIERQAASSSETEAQLTLAKAATEESIPPEVLEYAKDWPLAGRDYANTRWTQDSTITSQNVSSLGVAWSLPIQGKSSWGGAATTPLIMGDNVYSVDFKTGKVNWMQKFDKPWQGPNGVAVGWGKVFASPDLYGFAAFDSKTGKEVWNSKLSGFEYVKFDIQPTVYDHMVFVADAPHVTYDVGGMIGYLYAMDEKTGVVQWAFSTVADPDMWGHPELNSGGGAWQTPAIDLATGMIFWGTANPGNGSGPNGPYSGTKEFPNGSSRPGPNLYTNSMLAMDSRSGKLEWFASAFPHDLYDHDFMNPPILPPTDGAIPEMVIGSGKGGVVIAFDRQTGHEIWRAPVGKHQNDNLAQLPDKGIEVYPGVLGGVETPMAYADNLIYAAYDDLMTKYSSTGMIGPAPFNTGTGGIAAVDVNTGGIVWDQKLPALTVGAATVVNDLVFTATYDGTIYAFDKNTGKQVWKYKAPAGINGWPSVSGDTILWPCGVGNAQLIALRLGASGK